MATDAQSAMMREVDDALGMKSVMAPSEAEMILEEGKDAKAYELQVKINELMRQAEVASKTMDIKSAEKFYLQILTYDITPPQRRRSLLAMARLYEASKEAAKQAAVLEKFGDAFPDDPGLPQVYIKLGMLYRDLGLYNLALTRFYSVLNFALRVDASKIDTYRQLSIRAQMEIADTHFAMAKYEDAIKFFSRLKLLDLTPVDRANVLFKIGDCNYLLKKYPEAIASFESFIRDYPTNDNAPEVMFMLADCYAKVGRQNDSARTVLDLLKRQSEEYANNEKQWMFWQRKAGTQLANDFFNQSDYANALALYQAMLPLGKGPQWQWNLLYQIGMCFERLSLQDKATESYKQIIDWDAEEKNKAMEVLSLKSIYDMAKWRVDNGDWKNETNKQLEKLLDKNVN